MCRLLRLQLGKSLNKNVSLLGNGPLTEYETHIIFSQIGNSILINYLFLILYQALFP